MATNPDQRQGEVEQSRQREAAALALLLLGRKRYDLPALIAARRIRPRPMRRISPSGVLAGNIATPLLSIATAWENERAALVDAYEAAIAARAMDLLTREIDDATARAERRLAIVRRQMRPAIERIEQWHRVQWISRVRAATGLDVAMLTSAGDVLPEVDAATAWNEQLADDVHAQTKARIITALVGGAAVLAPATREAARARQPEQRRATPAGEPELELPVSVDEMIREAVAKAKTRARNIAVDQAEKASAGMTRARRIAAGVTTWRWRHYDPQPHPRIEHIRRDGKIYSDANPPATQPGEEPYCKCWEEPAFR